MADASLTELELSRLNIIVAQIVLNCLPDWALVSYSDPDKAIEQMSAVYNEAVESYIRSLAHSPKLDTAKEYIKTEGYSFIANNVRQNPLGSGTGWGASAAGAER